MTPFDPKGGRGDDREKAMSETSPMMPRIPDRVIAMPFWRPFGVMVSMGVKTIETRGHAFERAPCWIAVLNTSRLVRLQDAALVQVGAAYFHSEDPAVVGVPATCSGLIYVSGSRALALEDLPRSYFYELNRHAWLIDHAVHFATSIPIADLGLTRVPQGRAWVPGEKLRERLTLPLS
jgi:hypothetical protein